MIEDLNDQLRKLLTEKQDLQQHMAEDLEGAEEKMQVAYNKMLFHAIERIKDDKDTEIRKLEFQIAKYSRDTDIGPTDTKRELDFQNTAWQRTQEQAQLAQMRTLAARLNDENLMHCCIGFQRSLTTEERYTDEQAKFTIQSEINGKGVVLLGSTMVGVKEAISWIDTVQRKRVLDEVNARTTQQHADEDLGSEDRRMLLNDVRHNSAGGSPGRPSMIESIPPKLLDQSPIQPSQGRGNDDHSEGGDEWLFHPTHNGDGGKRGGGNGGGDGHGGEPGATTRSCGDDREEGGAYSGEFTLVNSRNFDVKMFSGESGSKLSYMEFNDNQRELASIKGKHGEILNNVLTWAEKKGDQPIIDNELKKLEEGILKNM